MTKWLLDLGTQAVAGLFSGAVVGGVLLYSQFRMERRLDRERRLQDAQRDLLSAAIRMHQVVGRTFVSTGSAERVGVGWNEAGQARAEWAAVEATWNYPKEVLDASRAAREALSEDLLAVMAMSPAGGVGEPSDKDRERWLAIGKRERPLELLEPLIAACQRMPE